MVALTAKIDPEIKQAGGRAHKHAERASNEKDQGYEEALHTQGQGQPSAPKQDNRQTLQEIDGQRHEQDVQSNGPHQVNRYEQRCSTR